MIAYNTLEKRGDYMENIEIKRINDEIYLTLNDIIEFQKIYDYLEEKLNLIKEQNNSLKINLYLGNRNITSQDLFCLCELILKDEKLLIKSINYNSINNDHIEIYKGSIRGGETKYFNGSVLLSGDINPNALVVAKDEVYVVGKIKGKIIIRNKNGGINGALFKNACIKIFDKVNYDVNTSHAFFIKYSNLLDVGEKGEILCLEL